MDKILIIDNASKVYPGRVAVKNISFSVGKGSIHGFLGPNGAGKSTTMKMIAGILPMSSGEISLFGKKLNEHDASLKNQIGLLPENAPLYLDMTVEDYLKYVAKIHLVKNVEQNVNQVMDELGLMEVRKRLIGNLSKGYKQRVGLAQAIVYDAPFIMLDEPTNGLDPHAVVELRNYIKKLAETKTILFSSHILSEVEQLCDQITIIHRGEIKASGNLSEITHKFKQGFSLRVGLKKGESLPLLDSLGRYEMTQKIELVNEDQYILHFQKEDDVRSEVARLLISSQKSILTLSQETAELEDIFLHMTEKK